MNVRDLTMTSLETITAFDPITGDFRWVLDELQNAKIANTQDTKDITGKQGRLLNTLKSNKAVTVSGTNGYISGNLMATQLGTEFEGKVTSVKWPDYFVVNNNASATAFKAVGTAGNEIGAIYVRNADGTLGDSFTQAATAGDGTFAYDPSTKVVTFKADEVDDGTEMVAYYFRKVNGDVVQNISDVYSEKATLYIDAFAEDKCGKVYHVQFYIPRADFNGNFDIELGDNQSVHAFEARSLAGGSCGAGVAGLLWTYTVIGEDAEDAA